MVIDSNGNVGIGIIYPGALAYKLSVNGKIGAREIIVTSDTWADYVFKKDYNLKPLNEVEKFIKSNKHLEGIPTEKEVKTNGIAVGDMQAKLLQKVEELTLYVINQDKKIDNLTQENALLKNTVIKLADKNNTIE
ncbi:MAG TPA: hypothetical protein DCO75_04340 [Fibrobacteres bacterium]|nr:hypothetical protein [Fibrobacterota bacterium]